MTPLHAFSRDLGLVLFVAVPLPMTGAWTGAVAGIGCAAVGQEATWVRRSSGGQSTES
ncbi:MAG: small multi-drug export protein [candidate division NC10 bacterium]|nr:small multi-drug export protein [candidate division NC10 bacterium]